MKVISCPNLGTVRGEDDSSFDAGDKFRDLNVANIAYAREDSYIGDTEPYDCSSRFNAREVQTLGPAFFGSSW